MSSKFITAAVIVVASQCLGACSFDVRYCYANGATRLVHVSQACPAGAQDVTRQQRAAEQQLLLDQVMDQLYGTSQTRISETAPPTTVGTDEQTRDPALRRHVADDNSQVHP